MFEFGHHFARVGIRQVRIFLKDEESLELPQSPSSFGNEVLSYRPPATDCFLIFWIY